MRAGSLQVTPTSVSTVVYGLDVVGAPARSTSRVPTLAQYVATWLESIEGLVRPRTLDAYARRLELHVLPLLGERRLDEIGIDDILALIAGLSKQGYAGTTIHAVLTPLSRLFAHAARRGLIEVNPISKLDRTERPRVWRQERPVLTRDEIGRLLEAASPCQRTILVPAVLSGLRQGELLGLRWRNIDFDNQVIQVRSALDRRQQDVPPKTQHAMRDVILMPALATLLQQHRNQSQFSSADDYVFATRVGTPTHWRNLSSRSLKPALKKASIQAIRWHDLRHTFASLLIAGGANVIFVSRQLGHSSSQITLGVYAHLFDRDEQAQRTREMLESTLGDAVRGVPSGTPPSEPVRVAGPAT
jgi:integrase